MSKLIWTTYIYAYSYYKFKIGHSDSTSRVICLFLVNLGLISNINVILYCLFILLDIKSKVLHNVYLLGFMPLVISVVVLINKERFWKKIRKKASLEISKKYDLIYWVYLLASVLLYGFTANHYRVFLENPVH